MRIIIVQSEIEIAIRNHVLTQIVVKEGQKISIEFKNTRGEDGFTAEVDINTSPNASSGMTQAYREASLEAYDKILTDVTQKSNTTVLAPAVEVGEPIKAQEPVQESVKPVSTTTDQIVETKVEEIPTATHRSLFANLTPPVNVKTAQ